jgi:nucleoside-diphosphate-sugar epimerase
MKTAIIGYSGFVGSNIDSQNTFDDKYDSKNIKDIAGKEYDLIVSAATRADMWRINQEPEIDLAEVKEFIEDIKKVKTKKFVLISTVGVYVKPDGVDEDTKIVKDGLPAYGLNRYYLEQFINDNFDALIVRLPGLFGSGLKKNVIYDFLHDNNIDRIQYRSTYQYYNLAYIWRDINIAIDNNLNLVNFATEPLRTDELVRECFGIENFINETEGVTPTYFDMHTKYAELYGKKGNYIFSKQEEIRDIKKFVIDEKRKQ